LARKTIFSVPTATWCHQGRASAHRIRDTFRRSRAD